MEAAATINVRMPESLKRNGSQVLERNDVSPTDIVRSVYRYMERNQEIPDCLDIVSGGEQSIYQHRRALLRQFDDALIDAAELDVKEARVSRIEGKYGDLL